MIAIHNQPGSFSDRWISYCEEHRIQYRTVDIFDHSIISCLRRLKVTGILFHISDHMAPRTRLAARSVCQSLEAAGIEVFPNLASYWHCDDKIAQHYLLEALDVPRCKTYIFYSRKEGYEWAATAEFPKVFKLRCGSGSTNVQLIRRQRDAERLVRSMFGRGMKATSGLVSDLSTKLYKHSKKRDWIATLKRLPATATNVALQALMTPRERGYAYFQDFLPNNEFDTRVTVIGSRAFSFRRFVRPDDFRASGSGRPDHDPDAIDLRCLRLAFETSKRLGSQCMAFDFVFDMNHEPMILEMCYAFVPDFVYECPGSWTPDLVFHPGQRWPQDVMLENFLQTEASQHPTPSLLE
jgi:glutathione synthase/RimK-type ligase-like ATP-grasp enzyme